MRSQAVECHADVIKPGIHPETVKFLSIKFRRYLVNNYYSIAIDGTPKFTRNVLRSEACLERAVKSGDNTQMQYYVYLLQANLSFPNGMSIPLMSEFLSYTEGHTDTKKQEFKNVLYELRTSIRFIHASGLCLTLDH